MIFISTFILMSCALYSLFLVSEKQITKTKKTKWIRLARYPKIVRITATLLLIIASMLLSDRYGNSIGFISLWIFLSPVIFGLILSVNDLKAKQKIAK